MATEVFPRALFRAPTPLGVVRGDPPQPCVEPFHPSLKSSTHVAFNVVKATPSPPPTTIVHLSVVNGYTGKAVHLKLKSGDTIGKLKADFLRVQPELIGSLHLVCDGRPLGPEQDTRTLAQLGLRHGATLITYQRCTRGLKNTNSALHERLRQLHT